MGKPWRTSSAPIHAAAKPSQAISLAGELAIEASAADAAGKPTGPPKFSMLAYNGGLLAVEGYPVPVIVDLAGMEARSKQTPLFFGHHDGSDGSRLVGHADQLDKVGGKLQVAGLISAATAHAAEVVEAARNGYQWQASIGAIPERASLESVPAGKTVAANGQTFVGPCIVARKSTLWHIAVLPQGADSKTSLSIAAAAAQPIHGARAMDFETWVKSLGLDPAALTDEQKAELQKAFDALQASAAGGGEGDAAVAAKAAKKDGDGKPIAAAAKFDLSGVLLAHEKHVAAIQAKAATFAGKLSAEQRDQIAAKAIQAAAELKVKALDESWSAADLQAKLIVAAAQAEAELLRAERPKGPAIHASVKDLSAPVIEAAMCRAAGLKSVEKQFDDKTLEAADKIRVMSLGDIIMAQARANGYDGMSGRIRAGNIREVLRHAFLGGAPIHAGFSTVSLPGVFSNVANKFLLEGFMDVEQVWREFAAIRSVSDFKTVTSYRMLDDSAYAEVGPSGEIEHGEVGEESYTNRAKTYAKMYGLTREQIINDDLGAFDTIRERLGRGHGIKLNRVFWAAFLDNSAFFTAGRGNLITTALGEAGIAAAELALASMTDGEGNPIDVGGQHLLLVPPALDGTARKWYVSQEIRDTTATTKTPTTNIFANKYRPVMSRYIATAYGGTATSWFLVPAAAGDMAPMEVCFLDGQQSPVVESAEADFSTLGVEFRGYGDFGCAKKEWRASIKSTGAG